MKLEFALGALVVSIVVITTMMLVAAVDMPPIRIIVYCESACPRPPVLRVVTESTETASERPTARAAASRLPAHVRAP